MSKNSILNPLIAMVLGGCVTYGVGTVLSTQFVLAGLGGGVGIADRLSMTMFDLANMFAYLVIILIGFAIAFPIATFLKPRLPRLAPYAYPLAGAAAVLMALGLMYRVYETIPISGARGVLGLAAQGLAGAIGGWAYAKIRLRVRG